MQFRFTEEQDQFRAVVQRFMGDKSPTTEVRRLMETDAGFDSAVWKQMADDLGLQSIGIPEAYGGSGFGPVEVGVVMEEMGRVLSCAPFFSSCVLSAGAILNVGSEEDKAKHLPKIASGETIACLALTEPNGRWHFGGIETIAAEQSGAYQLNGTKSFVIDGQNADLVLVAARTQVSQGAESISLFAVDAKSEGLTCTALKTMDPTRKQARIDLNNVTAELIGTIGQAATGLTKTLDQAAIALANESAGGAQYLLDSAIEYTKMRMQFGRLIGSFQAIKHKCADMLLDVELAKSAAYGAAEAAAEGDDEWPALASLAKASTSDAFIGAAATCIQLHGGIGFTWDNDTHLWFKRAKSTEVLLGDPSHHRELFLQKSGVAA